ncbi:MAG: hypothetical protein ACKV0T_00895 [Planctomycetales bacterium]
MQSPGLACLSYLALSRVEPATVRQSQACCGFVMNRRDHPDTVALFLMGCGGDQDPAPRRNQEDAEKNGLALASAVDRFPVAASFSKRDMKGQTL